MDTFLTHSLLMFIFLTLSKMVDKPKTNKSHGSVVLTAAYKKMTTKEGIMTNPQGHSI